MIITNYGKQKVLKNNIITIAQKAKLAKKADKNVIDSTIGMLNDENDEFVTFEVVKKVFPAISGADAFAYSATDGGSYFHKNVTKWVFGDYFETHESIHNVVVATAGGTGGLAGIIANYLNVGERVLVPNYMWESYITIAKEQHVGYLAYSLFDENNNFNIYSIKECIEELKSKQDTIVVIINDPCHNPTGYCMNDDDYHRLVNLINSYKDTSIVLVMDMAYFDYYNDDLSIIRNRYKKLLDFPKNVMVIYTFSGSKTFGLYGLRIGACIAVSKDENELKSYKDAMEFSARSKWGSSCNLGISIINSILGSEENIILFKNELKNICSTLSKRAQVFLAECNNVDLNILPFERGFFATIPCKNPESIVCKLNQKGAYFIPTKNGIRVALCAISVEESRKIPALIKNALLEENL